MDLGITGRRAFLAGSSSGMGAEIARGLAAEGVEVIVHGRNAIAADAVAADIRERGGTAHVVLGDLGTPEAVEDIAVRALAIGPIDILINCQGSSRAPVDWFNGTVESWQQQYQMVLIYALQLIKAFAPGMKERGWGRILNISSIAAVKALPNVADYSAAKLALHSLTATVVQDLGPAGVTCNILMSGLYESEAARTAFRKMTDAAGLNPDEENLVPEVLKLIGSHIPLGRGGRGSEFAATACFLVSEPAAFINGATLRVDGGNTGSISI